MPSFPAGITSSSIACPMPVEGGVNQNLTVRKPDGSVVTLPARHCVLRRYGLCLVFTQSMVPNGARTFAVNIDPLESKTTSMQIETLEQFGCRLADHSPKPLSHADLRQMYNAELENRQKLWRWLILAAIGVLIVETLLAGRRAACAPFGSCGGQIVI